MRDRAEVIRGLEVCVSREPGGDYICYKCPYEIDGNDCEINSIKDAIALLKEQETKPIEPVEEVVGDILLWHCGKCGFYIASNDNFCSNCGRRVKWDD